MSEKALSMKEYIEEAEALFTYHNPVSGGSG